MQLFTTPLKLLLAGNQCKSCFSDNSRLFKL